MVQSRELSAIGYSLWLIPEKSAYESLANEIKSCSERYGTPNFEPHVTLLGNNLLIGDEADMLVKTKKVAESLSHLDIRILKINSSREYFKFLYAEVEKTANLQRAYDLAKNIFHVETKNQYKPHLSFAYGEFTDGPGALSVQLDKRIPDYFTVDSLSLYKTEGTVGEWHKIENFPLI